MPVWGGRTTRISGAKRYARAGVPLLAIMHLGRWSSAAVLGYVEEALSEKALGEDAADRLSAPEDRLDAVVANLQTRIDQVNEKLLTWSPPSELRAVADSVAPAAPSTPAPDAAPRWVQISGGRCHMLASAALDMPSVFWKTRCGIRYAAPGRSSFVLHEEAAVRRMAPDSLCGRCPQPPWCSRADAAAPVGEAWRPPSGGP